MNLKPSIFYRINTNNLNELKIIDNNNKKKNLLDCESLKT